MAAVLDAFALYVNKQMKGVAGEELTMLLGISGEISKLQRKMDDLRAFVADAERRRITDMSVRRWARKLKDAMYDATDILDLCQLEADTRREPKDGRLEEMSGCFQPFLFCLRDPVFAHGIGTRIKELNQRLDGIHKDATEFGFINLSSYEGDRMPKLSRYSSNKTVAYFEESAIVGEQIQRDTEELVQELITTDGSNDTIKVLSVIGIGGVGKTTLAMKIFSDTTIQEHFELRIWLSITQDFDEVDLLRRAISHAGAHDHGGHQEKAILMRILIDSLCTGRFLLVMDDVWSEDAWNRVLRVPVMNAGKKQPGSRILVTTRQDVKT
ncbi:unnamed protein product [Urochloa humidicola]